MGLAGELLEGARYLAEKAIADRRKSHMRRPISTAYYAVFHLFVEDFVGHWEVPDQRADYDSGWTLVETDEQLRTVLLVHEGTIIPEPRHVVPKGQIADQARRS